MNTLLFTSATPLTSSPSHRLATRRRPRCPQRPRCLYRAADTAVSTPTLTDPAALRTFLTEHWGRTPILFRSLIPPNQLPSLTPTDLITLASSQAGPQSRLICGDNTLPHQADYTLQLGPFPADLFDNLPDTSWTLLVSDLDVHVPSVSDALLPFFSFVPSYRRADIMASYAPPNGGVGPHVDNFDVFLVQAAGRRMWRTAYTPIEPAQERLVPGLDVRVLQGSFPHDEEWILEPGDVLYVPPRIPHHGISLDEHCMTYSVGCRAPSLADVLAGWCEHYADTRALRHSFMKDDVRTVLSAVDDPSRISEQVLDDAFDQILNAMSSSDELRAQFGNWYAEQLSARPGLETPPVVDIVEADVDDMLNELLSKSDKQADADNIDDDTERTLVRQMDGAIFVYRENRRSVSLYVDGRMFPVQNVAVAKAVCSMRCMPAPKVAELVQREPSLRDVLKDLFMAGLLYLDEEGATDDWYAEMNELDDLEDDDDFEFAEQVVTDGRFDDRDGQ